MNASLEYRRGPPTQRARVAAILIAGALVLIGPRGGVIAATAAGVPKEARLAPSGPLTVKTDGAVIDARDVKGSIAVQANNVTIRRSRVTYDGYHSVRIFEGYSGTIIEDVTVTCTSAEGNGIVFGNYTARRVLITGCRNGFMSSASAPAAIEDSYWNGVPVSRTTAAPTPTVAPTTPTVAPTTTTSPPVEEFPTAATTGVPADVVLRPSSSLSVTTDGAVVDGLDVSGTIEINADDVTVKRSRIRTNGARYGIRVGNGASGVVIEDVEIGGTDTNCSAGVVYGGYTARRVNVYGCADGLKIGTDTTVESSYVHDQRKAPGTHNDAIQSVGGSNVRIVGNTIAGPFRQSTSAVLLQTNNSAIDNVLLEGNKMSGGSYVLYLKDKGNGHGAPTDITIRNNVWVRNSWLHGSHTIARGAGFIWQNNVYEDGTPVG